MKHLFSNLAWFDRLHFASMLLMSAALPVGRTVALWAALLLVLMSLVKALATHTIGNRALPRVARWALCAPVLYWGIHVLSLALGGDICKGLELVWLKASLLLFPAALLVADTSYLTLPRLRTIFGALWASCVCVFLCRLIVAIVRMLGGLAPASALGIRFDPTHHAYIALYLVSALAFVYIDLASHLRQTARWLRCSMVASVPMIVAYIVIVNSRAGMLALWLLIAVCTLHALRHFGWRSLVGGVAMVAILLGTEAAMPGHTNRLLQTAQNLTSGRGDARVDITRSSIQLATDGTPLGHGAANYRDDLVDQYNSDGFSRGVRARFNAHNQYIESLISTGIVGLVALLFFLLSPLWMSLCSRRRALFAALVAVGIACGNLLFESMLERQMGLLFFGWFHGAMVLWIGRGEQSLLPATSASPQLH